MDSSNAEAQHHADRADLWDSVGDERQRLADEREQLSNEREYLADERERLADEQERLLDQRVAVLADDGRPGEALDDELARLDAEGHLVRAEARLQRAVAERERAQLALDRQELRLLRRAADAERGTRQAEGDREPWETERRGFVATERDDVADLRDAAQTARDELADRRERDADKRDGTAREREQNVEARGSQSLKGAAATAQQQVRRARGELSQVRAAADRQRRAAALTRQQAAAERAEARQDASAASFMPHAGGPLLAAQFVDLTRELFASQQLSDIAHRVLDFALEYLPGFLAAGVTISANGLPGLRIGTDPVADQLDAFQHEAGRGPAVDALESPEPLYARTLAAWPDVASVATELGITGMLAHGLSVPRDGVWHPLGVLTLYAADPLPLDDGVCDLASVFAAYLSVAAGLERDRTDLRRREAALHRALSTRDVIGQAKGILMERQSVSAGDAFDILRRTSQHLNVRLHEIAARLADTGELPR